MIDLEEIVWCLFEAEVHKCHPQGFEYHQNKLLLTLAKYITNREFSEGIGMTDCKFDRTNTEIAEVPIEDVLLELKKAEAICDPIEFQVRQRQLLLTLARYIVNRDMPHIEDTNARQD